MSTYYRPPGKRGGHFRINFCQTHPASSQKFRTPLFLEKNVHPLDEKGVFEENPQRSFHRRQKVLLFSSKKRGRDFY